MLVLHADRYRYTHTHQVWEPKSSVVCPVCICTHTHTHKPGVEAAEFCRLSHSLFFVLHQALGDKWTPEVASAWRATWDGFQNIIEPALIASKCPIPLSLRQLRDIEYISPRAQELVQCSWDAHVSRDKRAYGVRMFLKMFKLSPCTLQLFSFANQRPLETSLGLAELADAFMSKFAFVIPRIGQSNVIVPYLQDTAVAHACLDVEPQHFVFMGKALLWSLEQGMGHVWNAGEVVYGTFKVYTMHVYVRVHTEH